MYDLPFIKFEPHFLRKDFNELDDSVSMTTAISQNILLLILLITYLPTTVPVCPIVVGNSNQLTVCLGYCMGVAS